VLYCAGLLSGEHWWKGCGGKYETNNAQLHMLMTNVVAGRMNFAGCGKKTGIVEMQLLNAVVGEL